MGAAHTGAVNMFKAWKDLSTDRELAAAFKDSNFFGNFRAEHDEITRKLTQGTINAPEKELDFGSDKFNADRLMLAAFYQRFQERAVHYKTLGITDNKDFVKKLLKGQLDATITMDAWVHAGEASMKTLGVDPLRMNKSGLERMPMYRTIVNFTSQPLRMARLMNQYMKEGQTDKVAYLMYSSMILGGGAAIPQSLRLLGQQYDPQSEYALEKALNDYSISGVAGSLAPEMKAFIPNLDAKLGYDPVNPMQFAGINTGPDLVKRGVKDANDLGMGARTGNATQMMDSGYRLAKDIGQGAIGKIGPVPANVLFKGAEMANDMMQGQMPVHFYNGDTKFADSQTIDLDQIPGGRLAPLVDKLLPGEPTIKREAYLNRKEAVDLKKLKIQDDQFFPDPLLGLSTKTAKVKKEREKRINAGVSDFFGTN